MGSLGKRSPNACPAGVNTPISALGRGTRDASFFSKMFRRVWFQGGLCFIAILSAAPAFTNALAAPAPRQFPPGLLRSTHELPPGRLRNHLERLPAAAQERALGWLRSFHFTEHDLETLHADAEGGIYYADTFELEPPADEAEDGTPEVAGAAVPVSPFPAGLRFHSRPGSANVIYLDFDGEQLSGSVWNNSLGRTLIPALPFSTDSDTTTYSDAEQAAIKRIWQRVAEDYAPFDVDVTTERPANFTSRTAQALITRNTDANGESNPSSSAGGVAYVNVFASSGFTSRRPAWVYANNLASNEAYIAEAASHEIGHNLGLSHDGTSSTGYYGGHGSGETSWGPIMGTGYGRNVSQWSKGEYYSSNNAEDDLTIISAKTSWRADDHADSVQTATALQLAAETNVVSTTPENDTDNANRANKGVIERNTDADLFAFTTGTGPVNLQVRPWVSPANSRGGNLDVVAELLDANSTLLLMSDPSNATQAAIQTNLPAGRYYLRVRNTGVGSPTASGPSGYTSYGSIGQYFISGTVAPASRTDPAVFTFEAAATPDGWGTVTPAGGSNTAGTVVQLLATPAPFYRFEGWTGGASGTQNPLTLTLASNVTVTAVFAELATAEHETPYSWLASVGYTNDFEAAAESVGANGMRVWESYIAGLDPSDPASQLRVDVEGLTANQCTLRWETVPGRTYTLLWSESPEGPFQPVTGGADLPAGVTNLAVTPASQIGFFRLGVRLD